MLILYHNYSNIKPGGGGATYTREEVKIRREHRIMKEIWSELQLPVSWPYNWTLEI